MHDDDDGRPGGAEPAPGRGGRPEPAAAPPPPPPAAKLSLAVEGAARSGRDRLMVSGQRWSVRGTVAPFAPGQQAVVRLFKGRRKIAVKRVPVVAAGPNGTFRMTYTATRTGRLRARATVGAARA
ncbi:MAG: hypothetical protein M3P50_05300, partial [Actinomycetota bacterium]|nr:hypothetical protein [Actinomycetota bacterium]